VQRKAEVSERILRQRQREQELEKEAKALEAQARAETARQRVLLKVQTLHH